jgi:CheY-like chemotaxis protein
MKNQEIILLVEDDIVDQMTVKRALKDINVTNPLRITNNGEEALEYLSNEKNELPGIILLDLNMPKMNGIEFLRIVKTDNRIKRIPVVVLTTSKEEPDRVNTFDLGIVGYMIKPVDYLQFVEVIKTINLYWMLSESPG